MRHQAFDGEVPAGGRLLNQDTFSVQLLDANERLRGYQAALEEARGNYKIVARLFNMEARDYKRFLNFLRKHDCQLPFKEYR